MAPTMPAITSPVQPKRLPLNYDARESSYDGANDHPQDDALAGHVLSLSFSDREPLPWSKMALNGSPNVRKTCAISFRSFDLLSTPPPSTDRYVSLHGLTRLSKFFATRNLRRRGRC
jgi:hypothetical protein